jgi:hypothetical protein
MAVNWEGRECEGRKDHREIFFGGTLHTFEGIKWLGFCVFLISRVICG